MKIEIEYISCNRIKNKVLVCGIIFLKKLPWERKVKF